MLTPTKEKTWNYSVNNAVNTGVLLTDASYIMYGIKAALVAAGWTVQMSSNRASYGAADYWASYANVVWTTNAVGSWIVLRNAQLAGGAFEVLLVCDGYGGTSPGVGLSVASSAFSGGSLTAAPTATNVKAMTTMSSDRIASGTAAKQWHVIYSSDLQVTRVFVTGGGAVNLYWAFEKLKTPPGNIAEIDNWNATAMHGSSGTGVATVAQLNASTANSTGFYNASTAAIPHGYTCESYNGTTLAGLVTAYSPEEHGSNQIWPAWPVGIVGYNIGLTPPWVYEPRGQLYDVLWGPNTLITGSTYDGAGSKTWVKMGALWQPWSGASPVIS